MTLDLLIVISKLIVLIFGSGFIMKLLLLRNQELSFVYELSLCCALGMTFLAVFGYTLSMLGVFNTIIAQASFFILALVFSLQWLVKRPFKIYLRNKNTKDNFSFLSDLILLALLMPTFLLAAVTPISDGDGLYSFNTWAMHWALRDDMSDYWFLAYGQLMSIVASWMYKLAPPWQGGISIEHHVLHAFYVFSAVLSLLIVRRIPRVFTTHWIGSLLGFGCATLLILQQDFYSSLASGRAEPILFLFEALIILELIKLHEAKEYDKKIPYRIGMLVAGLVFIKPSVVPLGIFFLLSLYLLTIKSNIQDSTPREFFNRPYSFICSVSCRSLFRPLIAGFGVLILIGPFYAFQYKYIGAAGYSHPENMSFGSGNILNVGKDATDDLRKTYVINGQTSSDFQLFTYRITEVFMSYTDRSKKLWAGIRHIGQIAVFLLITVGFILSFRFIWLWPLHLAAISQTILWYIYASFAYYDLTPAIILYVSLAGIGYVKILEVNSKRKASLSANS
jgi:hypothetical protein